MVCRSRWPSAKTAFMPGYGILMRRSHEHPEQCSRLKRPSNSATERRPPQRPCVTPYWSAMESKGDPSQCHVKSQSFSFQRQGLQGIGNCPRVHGTNRFSLIKWPGEPFAQHGWEVAIFGFLAGLGLNQCSSSTSVVTQAPFDVSRWRRNVRAQALA
jgi:hypothetical protein